jgi:putative transposase
VSDNQATYRVSTMCRVLEISRTGFYAWRDRAPSARTVKDEALTKRIEAIHEGSRGIYGAPRVHAELRDEHDVHIGKKRVARLMRGAGIKGVSRRRFKKTTERSPTQMGAPDLVKRDFTASAPDELWVADITYIPTWAGFLYLAVVLDAWSRKIVGWKMANHLRTELVLDALDMAVRQRQPVGVIHHSDKGCQYTSLAFGHRCRAAGVRPSTGSVGDSYDNAMCESFFATLKHELTRRHIFKTKAQAEMTIFEFIEGFYNPRRRHSALDYKSPIKYEQAALAATEIPSG